MKPEIFARTRHDINAPSDEKDAVEKLEKLNEFLGKVKTSARLRAKDELGTTFLHTRTGTIFGRFLKWLTVGWPEAIRQRQQAKTLIEDVLSKLNCESGDAKALKDKIINETLAVKKFSEFNIINLKTQLNSLRNLIESDNKEKSAQHLVEKSPKNLISNADSEASANSRSSSDEDDFQFRCDINRPKLKKAENIINLNLLIESDSEEDPEDELASLLREVISSKKTIATPTGDTRLVSNTTEAQDTLSPGNMPDESGKTTASTQSLAAESAVLPETQAPPVPLAQLTPDATDPAISVKPADINISAKEEKSSFGCYEIKRPLSASKVHKIGAYQADAYILPGSADDLEFDLGKSDFHFQSKEKFQDDLRLFTGTHSYHDEKRSFKKLLLSPIRETEDGPVKSMSAAQQVTYLQVLRERYTSALTLAAEHGAKTIALKPLSTPFGLLTSSEIETLAQAVTDFQKTHAGVKIQLVFTRAPDFVRFNTTTAGLATSQ